MTGDVTLSIVLGSSLTGLVRAGETVFGAIALGRERDWEKGYLTEGKDWRLRMIGQSPECCRPCPCVVLGSTGPTPSLGNLIFQALIYMLMIQKFLCPTLTSLLNNMSKCLLFIKDFTSNSARPKIELITFLPKRTLPLLLLMTMQVSKIQVFQPQVPSHPTPPPSKGLLKPPPPPFPTALVLVQA